MIASSNLDERARFFLNSRENISIPSAITTNPNTSLMDLTSTFFSKNALGMLPASTRIAKGRKTFGSRLLRFFQVRIRFAGYPSNRSTGEILAFAAPKLKMVVNISVLANPHNPLTKYAVKAAINHRIMAEFTVLSRASG